MIAFPRHTARPARPGPRLRHHSATSVTRGSQPARPTSERESLHGVRQIVRFNWPFYLCSVTLIVVTPAVAEWFRAGALTTLIVSTATALTALWTIGSLAASWMVYDRSPLMNVEWVADALGFRPRTWINIHAGFDETTALLQRVFDGTCGRAFDIFDPAEMPEPSIARARRLCEGTTPSEPVDFRHLPVMDTTVDAVMLLLSAHELRTDDARCALLGEIRRALTEGGRVVVAEHLRDVANFAAFGPGFLHFHSHPTWTRGFARAGLAVHREFSITPFVHVFVLEKNA